MGEKTEVMADIKDSNLFQPVQVGTIELSHRIVLAPLTRSRANNKHVPQDMTVEYYAQRSRTPGTLLITESVYIAQRAVGRTHNPGVWSEEQILAWEKVSRDTNNFPFLFYWIV